MADEQEPPAHEWEVVSLTASTFAAAPGPEKFEMTDDGTSNSEGLDGAKTSDPLFMSGHFVLPPRQHENLAQNPESKEIQSIHESEYAVECEDFGCNSIADEGFRSQAKYQNKINIDCLGMSDIISEKHFDEKSNTLPLGAAEFEEGDELPALTSVEKAQSIYNCPELGSLCSELIMSGATARKESSVIAEVSESKNLGLDPTVSDSPNPKNKNYDACNLPCGAWWKRKAVALYAHAKEGDRFWSIFVAAAVMGLVILGQRWQQENWQLLQLRWHMSVNDEKMGSMFGPLARFKDVLVGGHRRASFVKGSS